jgi:transposase
VERSFAWTVRFRRLTRDYERLPQTVAGLHFVAFVCLMLNCAYASNPNGLTLFRSIER